MSSRIAVVVTSISAPNSVLRALALDCKKRDYPFYVIGDVPSPTDFSLDGCTFLSLQAQRLTGLQTAEKCPERHYARKNVGYLLAIRDGAELIVETDDDNFPRAGFWDPRSRMQSVPSLQAGRWVNIYKYFTAEHVWPRGLPLTSVLEPVPPYESCSVRECDCPIQQGLADENPDVDAIYRLTLPLPLNFQVDRRIALGKGSWCPFNSQNTATWSIAYPLLYLPAYCSFRMTDIWRSFVAQRICWENEWSVLFHGPTVWQDRNEHNLMRDFQDEIPGYLHNETIREILTGLTLRSGVDFLPANLRLCYEALIKASLLPAKELVLLEAWLNDLTALGPAGPHK